MDADAVIIGAGPAGCSCAIELVRQKKRAVVFEKDKPGAYKACGGMLRYSALEELGFPVHFLDEAGAVRMEHFIFSKGKRGCIKLEETRKMHAAPRAVIDSFFQKYAADCGVKILFSTPVRTIVPVDGGYEVNGITAKNVVLACGAYSRIEICGKNVLPSNRSFLPVAVSAEIEGTCFMDHFYYIDFDRGGKNTYAWLFNIGKNLWNIGVGLEDHKETVNACFDSFFNYIYGNSWDSFFYTKPVFIHKPQGRILGTHSPLLAKMNLYTELPPHIYCIGDTDLCVEYPSGEGIPEALQSGKKLALELCGACNA